MDFVHAHPFMVAVATVALTYLVRFLVQGYTIRSRLHKLVRTPSVAAAKATAAVVDVQFTAWSSRPLHDMGSLKAHERHDERDSRQSASARYRLNGHEIARSILTATVVIPSRLKQKYDLPNMFYLDIWPVGDPFLFVLDPAIAQQVTVDHVTPKHPALGKYLSMLLGPGDMVSSHGEHWKRWRSVFNPGFAGSHLMSLVPGIVDESLIFCEKMGEHAEDGKVFRLEEEATRLTVDIIGKVALDAHLGTQRGEHKLVHAFRSQVAITPTEGLDSPLTPYQPRRRYKMWKNDQIMVNEIGRMLDERFSGAVAAQASDTVSGQKKPRKRAIIDLALDAYRQEDPEGAETGAPKMDARFRRAAITQIRTFIFAGHDTTSSTICYALYELQRHPICHARIRQEYDEVLGSIERAPGLIKDDPHVLNKLEYTMAVIKETLRL